MKVLGVETSCDETAAAVVTEQGVVLSDVVQSQIDVHAKYGGVVPELASRAHLTNVVPVITEAVNRAELRFDQLDGIAVTCRPGLAGALLVGVQTAQALAWSVGLPIVGVDHLIGHLLAVYLQHPGLEDSAKPELPYIALLASGGHTALYRVTGPQPEQIHELGATRDDAAGEAFDKVAKMLGLGYPGGPVIDRLAKEGDPDAIELARPMARRDSLEFSFSGLKTSVARHIKKHGLPGDDQHLRDICAAFQRRAVDTLVRKAVRASRVTETPTIVLGGGVAANGELRTRCAAAGAKHGIRVIVPPFKSCTDNAAMIAYAGTKRLALGHDDTGVLTMNTKTCLPRVTRKGGGRRARP